MEPDELCLSDVHLEVEHKTIKQQSQTKTVFEPSLLPTDYEYAETIFKLKCPIWKAVTDEDGDVCFSQSSVDCNVSLQHALATRLCDVGLQIWPAAIVLADFIIHNACFLRDSVILDLGTGLGLTSIIAGFVSRTVFATDIGDGVLSLLEHNVTVNSKTGMDVRSRWLDWRKPLDKQDAHGNFTLQPSERNLIFEECTHVLAADVIYDLDATSALFELLDSLRKQLTNCCSKTVWIAMERRLNFTLDDLEVSCPAYNHFLECLQKYNLTFCSHKVPLSSFGHFLEAFGRSKYMEVWELYLEQQ